MNTKAVNSVAGVILAAQTKDRTPAGIALALDAAGLILTPEIAAEVDRLRGRCSGVTEAHAARAVLAEQLGDGPSASAGLIAALAKAVRDCSEHDHPTWEDLFCLNLTSYMGERMGPVLRRLLDAEGEAARARARAEQLTADNEALQRDKEQLARVAGRRLAQTDVAAWLRKKARECPTAPERQESAPAAIARLADKVARGAIRPETGGAE